MHGSVNLRASMHACMAAGCHARIICNCNELKRLCTHVVAIDISYCISRLAPVC